MQHPDQFLNSILPNSTAALQFQRNIRNNANDVKEYLTDLYKWESEVDTKKSAPKTREAKPASYPIRGAVEPQDGESEGIRSQNSGSSASAVDKSLLRKNKVPLTDYYKAWDKLDISDQLEQAEMDDSRFKLAPNPYLAGNPAADHPFLQKRGEAKSKNVGLVVQGGITRRTKGEIEDLKNDGNEQFRQRDYTKAVEIYTQCLTKIEGLSEQQFQDSIELYASVLGNRAQCWIQLQELTRALKDCDKAVSVKPDYAKGYFKKAMIFKKMEDYKGALEVLTFGRQFAPDDSSYTRELELVQAKIKEIKQQILASMKSRQIPDKQTFVKISVVDDIDLIKKAQMEASGGAIPYAESKETLSTNSSSERGSVLSNFAQNWNDPSSQLPKVTLMRCDGDQGLQDLQAGEFLSLKKIEKPTVFKTEQKVITAEPQLGNEEERQTRVRFTIYLDDQGLKKAGGRAKLKVPKKGILKKAPGQRMFSESGTNTKLEVQQARESTKPIAQLAERVIDVILRDSRVKLLTAKTSSHFEEVWRSFKNNSVRQLWSLIVLNCTKLGELYRSRAIEHSLTTSLGLLDEASPPSLKDFFKDTEPTSTSETILEKALDLVHSNAPSEADSSGNSSQQPPETLAQAKALLLGLLRDTLPKLQGFRMSVKMLTPSEKSQLSAWLNQVDLKFPPPSSESPALRDLYFLTTLKK